MAIVRFGERMRTLREERGWSIREASRRLGIDDYSYLRDVEVGKFLPTESRLRKLARLYAVSMRKMTDWVVTDRLERAGERSPGVNWFMRSLEDLDERGQEQAIGRLLAKLADRQAEGEPWPDQFEIRTRRKR